MESAGSTCSSVHVMPNPPEDLSIRVRCGICQSEPAQADEESPRSGLLRCFAEPSMTHTARRAVNNAPDTMRWLPVENNRPCVWHRYLAGESAMEKPSRDFINRPTGRFCSRSPPHGRCRDPAHSIRRKCHVHAVFRVPVLRTNPTTDTTGVLIQASRAWGTWTPV